jgi:hypothetical protein
MGCLLIEKSVPMFDLRCLFFPAASPPGLSKQLRLKSFGRRVIERSNQSCIRAIIEPVSHSAKPSHFPPRYIPRRSFLPPSLCHYLRCLRISQTRGHSYRGDRQLDAQRVSWVARLEVKTSDFQRRLLYQANKLWLSC